MRDSGKNVEDIGVTMNSAIHYFVFLSSLIIAEIVSLEKPYAWSISSMHENSFLGDIYK